MSTDATLAPSPSKQSSSTDIRHPRFARMFDSASRKMETRGQAEHRQRLLAGVSGRVVEVGAGNGLNFPYYPPSVTEVAAVEPEPYLRDRAREAAVDAQVPITVLAGTAEALPLEDDSVDVGIASLVLCSVDDPAQALAELRRVIRPGGELRFYEHVAAPSGWFRRGQRAFDLFWPYVAGGCHACRDTEAEIIRAGFEIDERDSFSFRPLPVVLPTAPHVLGIAHSAV